MMNGSYFIDNLSIYRAWMSDPIYKIRYRAVLLPKDIGGN